MVPGLLTTGLPVDERAYHQFWRTPQAPAWRPTVATIVGVLLALAVSLAFGLIAAMAILAQGKQLDVESLTTAPAAFLMNNLSLAMLIAIAMGVSVWFLRQPGRWMSSVVGRLRWRWLFKCALVISPLWLTLQGVELWLSWNDLALAPREHTLSMIVVIAMTQVFQCAGEEYGFRGIINRGVAALAGNERVAFVLGGAVSSLAFMAVHGAGDLWLNSFYFVFGMCTCFLAWRTGGLEASIAVHCVNNLVALSLLPFQDMSGLFDRSAGAGSPWMLINMTVLVGATALLAWLARRDGLVVRTAPGRALLPPPVPYTAWS